MSVLSPFSRKGFIPENFNQEGKITDESDLLQMSARGDVTKRVLIFRIFR